MKLHRGGVAVVRKKTRSHVLDGVRVDLIRKARRPWSEFWLVRITAEDAKKVPGPLDRTVHEAELEAIAMEGGS